MHYSSALFALAAPLLVSAAPTGIFGKRAAADLLVFQFADVLEQLESSFYHQALAKFKDSDFTSAGFSSSQLVIEQIQAIASDETTHSSTLEAAIASFGGTPITGCQFNFDSALTDVAAMAATARVVENVGVAAYLGGATLLTDPVLLAAAGSILTVEARHQTILNLLSGTGTAIPSAFDFALTPSEVLALASPFITGGCNIPIPSNTPLSLTNTGTVGPGTALTFQAATINGTISTNKLFCQMLVGGAPFAIVLPFDQCVVPQGINGPVAIFITSDDQALLNDVHDRAQGQVVAGPTMAFIDTQPQLLGQLINGGSGGSSSTPLTSTSTLTISPAQASALISSADGGTATLSITAVATPTSAVPSGTNTLSASTPTGSVAANLGTSPSGSNTGGPNLFTGTSGSITVNGWSNI